MTNYHTHHAIAAKNIINRIGKKITIGVPLGIGKPIGLLNALYQLADADRTINLTIITGLTLARPIINNPLEKLFVEPILDRMLKDYEDPLYEKARSLQKLPDNIKVIEFFLAPGKYLHNQYAQQNYISSAYTTVVSDTAYYAINILAQQVARSNTHPELYSLSCNTDLFHQVAAQNKNIFIIAEVNLNLPFMPGDDAVVTADQFTDIIDTQKYRALFSLPREELSMQDHAIGLHTSCLIKDDSCIQIGIGGLNSAVTNALIMRHKQNAVYQDALKQLGVSPLSSLDVFDKGLYASTEMFSDDYMHLYNENILKKQVYDDIGLQKLLNMKKISEKITPDMIDILIDNNIINKNPTDADIKFLLKFGILKSDQKSLGDYLKTGKILHAGFFLGGAAFYQQLRDLPPDELQKFGMTSISRTNTLSWSYELAQLQRQQARFINFAMMVTLGGAVVSDGVKDLQEVSGVGGQFDFVHMAHTLPDARSIIVCRSVRKTKKGLESNIIWQYPNITIPRYFRDIVVTEYGIADCRSKTDSEVIKALLNITDSRFQKQLLGKSKKYGKVPQDYEIPICFQHNYPDKINSIIRELQTKGYCKPYPFGSELTDEEKVIQQALLFLKKCGKFKLILLAFLVLFRLKQYKKHNEYNYLARMKLDAPKNLKAFFYKNLLLYALSIK